MEMQERIDTLIKMRKEKPEAKDYWLRLAEALHAETGLLTSEQAVHLKAEFKAIHQQEILNRWDDKFHEVVITGKFRNAFDDPEYSIDLNGSFGSAPIKAEGSPVTWGITPSKLTLSQDQMEAARLILNSELKKARRTK